MEIRFYQAGDFAGIVELWKEAGLLSNRLDPAFAIPRMANGRSSALFVAMENEEIAGTIMAGDNGYRGWVQKLAIAKKFQGQGYAKELVKAAERWMIARGLTIAHLIVNGDNKEAESFYPPLGYEKTVGTYFSHRLDKDQCDFTKAELDVIVTYLEMASSPKRPSVPMPFGQYILLKLRQPSAAFYRFLYNSVGEIWFWTDRRKMSDEELLTNIGNEKVEIHVLYANGEPAGFIELDFRETGIGLIGYFGLFPQWIGRGLGKYLLNWGIDYAWQKGIERLTVETCTLDHPRALAQYQKAGFTPYKRRHKRIIDPRLAGDLPHHLEPILPSVLMMQDLT